MLEQNIAIQQIRELNKYVFPQETQQAWLNQLRYGLPAEQVIYVFLFLTEVNVEFFFNRNSSSRGAQKNSLLHSVSKSEATISHFQTQLLLYTTTLQCCTWDC